MYRCGLAKLKTKLWTETISLETTIVKNNRLPDEQPRTRFIAITDSRQTTECPSLAQCWALIAIGDKLFQGKAIFVCTHIWSVIRGRLQQHLRGHSGHFCWIEAERKNVIYGFGKGFCSFRAD